MSISNRLAVTLESLESRRLMAFTFTVNGAATHPISPYIYGSNQGVPNSTFERLGGNRWTAYNWENNASNAGSDYLFQNDSFLSASNTPGAAVASTLNASVAQSRATLLTIQMADYVSADKNGNGDVRNSGSDYLSTRFNQVQPRKGSAFSLTPDLSDDFVYADEFVNWVKQTYPTSITDPSKPVWFDLDNEPDLWSSTHAEVHPAKVTYAELIGKTIDYAKAIKDVMPGTKVFGPASYGFNGYVSLQNATDAGGRDFLNTYLAQLKNASQTAGKRLVDVLDLHWYPEAKGGGVRITENNNTAAVVAARLQAPRSLWDSSYRETSWIADDYLHAPINLIHRLQGQIASNYAGTDLGFGEYNYGGGNHISGGIAQADVLGILGRESVFSANQWKLYSAEPFVNGAFAMFRNYDTQGSTFGNTSLAATTTDNAGSSVYASIDSADPRFLTLVALNKTATAQTTTINLSGVNVASNAVASLYRLAGTNSSPQAAGTVTLASNALSTSLPAYSVTTIRIPRASITPPQVTAHAFEFETQQSVSFTFDRDVSASLGSDDLILTRGNATLRSTGVTYDAASNRATFTMPALADGDWLATLPAASVTDAAGTPLASNATANFFTLAGDLNRDRRVDFNDLVVLAANYNTTGKNLQPGQHQLLSRRRGRLPGSRPARRALQHRRARVACTKRPSHRGQKGNGGVARRERL